MRKKLHTIHEAVDKHVANLVVCGSWKCWRLAVKPQSNGYVNLGISGKYKKAHRVFYEALIGPIPRGLTLDHLCRNRWCCHPNHVEPVTMRINVLRGSSASALNASKDLCIRGHEFDAINPDGSRRCSRCCRNNLRRRRHALGVKPRQFKQRRSY